MVNKRRPQKKIKPVNNEREYKINDQIEASEVRLVNDGSARICSLQEALNIASDAGLDLVEINNVATPPICKIVDYSKFKYEQKKIKESMKSRGQNNIIKEINIAANIGENDIAFKQRHAMVFLQKGFSVKVTLVFLGRTILFKEEGRNVLISFVEGLRDYCKTMSECKDDGKKMSIVLMPKR